MSVRLRRHHVLCSIGFAGAGYDDAFTANMSRVVYGTLRAPDGVDTRILVSEDADCLCAPCPRRRGLGCEAQSRIDALDAAHGATLGLAPGDALTWGACLDLVRERVVPDDLDRICAGCRWLPMGLCKAAVADLLETGSDTKKGRLAAALDGS